MLADMAFYLFAAFNGLRVFSYLPQIHRIAVDRNGASAISYTTWAMWTGANATTALYAHVNLDDAILTAVSLLNAACCAVIIALTAAKRRRHAAVNATGADSRQRETAWYIGRCSVKGRSGLHNPADDCLPASRVW